MPSPPASWLVAYPVAVLAMLAARGLHRSRLRRVLLDELRTIATTSSIAAMAMFSVRALASDDPFLAAQGVRQWLLAVAALTAGRSLQGWVERRAHRRGWLMRPTLIIGAGLVGQRIAKRLLDHPESGLSPVGFLDKEPLEGAREVDLPILGASWDLERAIQEHDVECVIVAFSTAPHHVLLDILSRCESLGVTVSLVPRLFESVTERVTVEHFGNLPLLTASRSDPKGWQFELKYACDRAFAAICLVLLSPILALTAIAVLLTSGRPVLFRQTRVGLDGKVFEILKFRTMRPPKPGELDGAGADGAGSADDSYRLTPLGRILRWLSIDELPQLWNVLRGDMSLIGPRPEQPEFARTFERYVYRYGDRHRVKSGITGWAQVHGIGRGTDRFSSRSLHDRVEWDNYYIENWSFWLDVKILIMTVAAVLRFRQA